MLNLAGLPKKFGFMGIAILAVSSLVLNAAAPRGFLQRVQQGHNFQTRQRT
jgi:hypothetical protein